MNSRKPMQTLFRDAFLGAGIHNLNKPISEIAAYLELLINSPQGVNFVAIKPEAGDYAWRMLLLTESVAIHGTFGTNESGKGRFFADLRVEPVESVTAFAIGPDSSAVREGTGHVSRLDPEIVVKFSDWTPVSIGGRDGFGWGFPEGTEDAEKARDELIRKLLKAYLSEG